MPGPRNVVAPPTVQPLPYGLLSVVQPRFNEPDPHWRNGVQWDPLCGLVTGVGGGFTYDDFCVTGVPGKGATATINHRGATPFVAMARVDCSPVGGFWETGEALAAEALGRSEPWQVERAFWTGSPLAGSQMFPHLAANAAVLDSTQSIPITLQTAATVVTGVAVDPVEGLGMLEGALADCYNQQGVIHIPADLIPHFDSYGLLKTNGNQMRTLNGNLVAAGNGYPGTGPDGTSLTNAMWIYATGQVFAYRSEQLRFRPPGVLDKSENTAQMIAERFYVLGWDCCHLAIPISTGGRTTGTAGSPA